ncbi:MAG: hypothetical protein V1859_07600 [archaeon]
MGDIARISDFYFGDDVNYYLVCQSLPDGKLLFHVGMLGKNHPFNKSLESVITFDPVDKPFDPAYYASTYVGRCFGLTAMPNGVQLISGTRNTISKAKFTGNILYVADITNFIRLAYNAAEAQANEMNSLLW